MANLAHHLSTILEDVDTAPEGEGLDAALDALTDFVQDHRAPIMAALSAAGATPPPPPGITVVQAPDDLVLRAFLRMLEANEGMNYVPRAVSQRGQAYIPIPPPAQFTEEQFQALLQAEINAAVDSGDELGAKVMERDLVRRRNALAAQERRDKQIAALGGPSVRALPQAARPGL